MINFIFINKYYYSKKKFTKKINKLFNLFISTYMSREGEKKILFFYVYNSIIFFPFQRKNLSPKKKKGVKK